jgi:hypothetical protein
MIIWDTGEYEVLPYYATKNPPETDDSASDVSILSTEMAIKNQRPSESKKLREAFQNVTIPETQMPFGGKKLTDRIA